MSEKSVIYCDLCEEILTFDLVEGSQTFIDEHCKSRRHVRFHRHKEEADKKDANDDDEADDDLPSTSQQQDDSKDDDGVGKDDENEADDDE